MRKSKYVLILFVFVYILNGCKGIGKYPNDDAGVVIDSVKVNNTNISVENINNEIMQVFNNALYYQPDGLFSQFRDTPVEYELYFVPDSDVVSLPKIYLIVTNKEHPLSDSQSSKRYKFGISLTENGLQSDFCEQSYVNVQSNWSTSVPEEAIYLGHYTMQINKIVQPIYEEMSDSWKRNAETAIRFYMDKNDFYSKKDKNLQPGKYKVYVRGFYESDADSVIVFEHENGSVYLGQYYFVHHIPDGIPANLNHVELVKNADSEFEEYLRRLKLTTVLHMEYVLN